MAKENLDEIEEFDEIEEPANDKYVNSSYYFFGNEVSEEGKRRNRVDYCTLAKAIDCVMNNHIFRYTIENNIGYWELINGSDYNEKGDYSVEIFQYLITDERGAEILQEYTNEIVYYNEELDMYLWGITHYGTCWDYVMTDIRIEIDKEN